MKRRIIQVLAGIALLIWLAATAGWVQSYFAPPGSTTTIRGWMIRSQNGRLEIGREGPPMPGIVPMSGYTPPAGSPTGISWHAAYAVHPWFLHGLVSTVTGSTWRGGTTTRYSGIEVHYTLPWSISAIVLTWYLAMAIRNHRRRLRSVNSICAHCGYDLRATPERCPECGTVVKPPATIA